VTVANAATYYVATEGNDSVSCETATNVLTPKRTISNALDCPRAGDTLFIRAGTYGEAINGSTRTIPVGTSWSAPVTIAGYPGEVVILKPVNVCEILNLPASYLQYIIFKDMILDGADLTKSSAFSCVGINLQPATHHLRFQNLEVKNSPWSGILGGGSYHEFINLKVHHNGMWTVTAGYAPGANGAYLTTTNSLISGGEYYDNLCYGVRFYNSDATKSADGNVVKGARLYKNGNGVAFNGTASCGSAGGGIVLGDKNNAAYNNLIYENYWGLVIASKPASGVVVYNNTLYKNRHGINISAVSQNAQVINNIICQNGSGITNAGSGTSFQANLCSVPGNGCTLIGDPSFANAASFDLRLLPGSLAEDAGVQLGTVDTDLSRVPRPQGYQYDIGAYEGTGAVPPPPENLSVR
jgi:hypothetical protein